MTSALTRQIWLTAPMMRGDDVLAVQRRLATLGLAVAQDGNFARATRDAVSRFQSGQQLKPDGVVGNLTWRALFPDAPLPADPAAPASLKALSTRHRHFQDGPAWRLVPGGVEIEGKVEPPDEAQQRLAARVMSQFLDPIMAAIRDFPVPIETIVACICTESSGNPAPPIRMEPGCNRSDPSLTPARCSHGLMQTLLSTARAALGRPSLGLDDLADPAISIRAGTAYMAQQATETRHDPPLAAAAYNAGSLRYDPSPGNRWHLVQYPLGTSAHVDRFVLFTNAAMAAAAATTLPEGALSLRRILSA